MHSKVVGVVILDEAGIAHIECYKTWLKEEWLDYHGVELFSKEKGKILHSLRHDPITKHLEVMEQYIEAFPFFKNDTSEMGEWCVLCGEEITPPWCKECGEPVDYTGTRTPDDRFLCHECAIRQRNKDHLKALTEYTQELEQRRIELWNKGQQDREINKEVTEKLHQLEEIDKNGPFDI